MTWPQPRVFERDQSLIVKHLRRFGPERKELFDHRSRPPGGPIENPDLSQALRQRIEGGAHGVLNEPLDVCAYRGPVDVVVDQYMTGSTSE